MLSGLCLKFIRKSKLLLLIKGLCFDMGFFIFLKASGESVINLTALEQRAVPS